MKAALLMFEISENCNFEEVVKEISSTLKRHNVKNISISEVIDSANQRWKNELKDILQQLLIVPGNNSGYDVLLAIMEEISMNPQKKGFKSAYSEVARNLGINYSCIERRIRHVIEKIYEYNTAEDIARILGVRNRKITCNVLVAVLEEKVCKD